MTLTDIQIKRAKPQDKAYTLNDGQGLSLLINPDGSKGWRFRFRFAGKARLISFGSYDLITLAEAREKREVARKQVANGIDPLEERKAQKMAQQFSSENSFKLSAVNDIKIKLATGLSFIVRKSLKPLSKMFSRSLVNALLAKLSH